MVTSLVLAPETAPAIETMDDVTYAAMSTPPPTATHEHIARRTRQRDTPPARAVRLTQTRNGRQPGPHAYLAPRTCLAITLALACLSLAHLCKACPVPCAPPPARHQPARQGINHTSNSPPRSSLHHRRPNIKALIKDAERAAASSNSSSEQQQQQRAAATTANNSSEQKERAAAASSSSEQQQRAAAAVSSSSEQQQQRAASNSSREQQQQQRAAAAIAAAVVNPTYPPVHPYVLSNVYPACISRMYLPYLECISVNISYLSRMISQYRARHSYKKSL